MGAPPAVPCPLGDWAMLGSQSVDQEQNPRGFVVRRIRWAAQQRGAKRTAATGAHCEGVRRAEELREPRRPTSPRQRPRPLPAPARGSAVCSQASSVTPLGPVFSAVKRGC